MSLYNMLFGINSQTPLLLAVLGLKENDVERLRDVHASEDGKTIEIYTRTGGGNRDSYPNMTMRKLKTWQGSADDDFDSTYCTDTFSVPEKWVADVLALKCIAQNGIRKAFMKHLSKTILREPTEADKETAAYEKEASELKRLKHFNANGHTFVPHDDYAMEGALKLAEANGGSLRGFWGIMPLAITVKRDFYQWPNARSESDRDTMTRVEVSYDSGWAIDVPYWEHCQKRFADKYPLAMAKIAESVRHYLAKAA